MIPPFGHKNNRAMAVFRVLGNKNRNNVLLYNLLYKLKLIIGGETLPKKLVGTRLDPKTIIRLDAWALLLKKDKTEIIEESIALWESNRSEIERRSIDTIIGEIQKHNQ